MTRLSATVVVITWNRPQYVQDNLEHLMRLQTAPQQVLVVDASPDERTAAVVAGFPGVVRLPFPPGAGHMTTSRNHALEHATGDVVCYLDDDANVQPQWLTEVLRAFEDPIVGAVSGRTRNGQPGEAEDGPGQVGRLLDSGELTGHFACDTGETIEVDHGIGANMSFRSDVLAQLGGFRDDFPGTALREDSDLFLRVRALGHKAVFTPFAVADHVAAPHVKGQRFDFRYLFWARHNHVLLLARNVGLLSPMSRRWLARAAVSAWQDAHPVLARKLFRGLVATVGLLAGLVNALGKSGVAKRSPVRQDATGQRIRAVLSSRHGLPGRPPASGAQ